MLAHGCQQAVALRAHQKRWLPARGRDMIMISGIRADRREDQMKPQWILIITVASIPHAAAQARRLQAFESRRILRRAGILLILLMTITVSLAPCATASIRGRAKPLATLRSGTAYSLPSVVKATKESRKILSCFTCRSPRPIACQRPPPPIQEPWDLSMSMMSMESWASIWS